MLLYTSITAPIAESSYFISTNLSVISLVQHPAVSLLVHSGSHALTMAAFHAGVPSLLIPATLAHHEVAYRVKDYAISIEKENLETFVVAWAVYHLLSEFHSTRITLLSRRLRSSPGLAGAVRILKAHYDLLTDSSCLTTSCSKISLERVEDGFSFYRLFYLDVFVVFVCILSILSLLGRIILALFSLFWKLAKAEYNPSLTK